MTVDVHMLRLCSCCVEWSRSASVKLYDACMQHTLHTLCNAFVVGWDFAHNSFSVRLTHGCLQDISWALCEGRRTTRGILTDLCLSYLRLLLLITLCYWRWKDISKPHIFLLLICYCLIFSFYINRGDQVRGFLSSCCHPCLHSYFLQTALPHLRKKEMYQWIFGNMECTNILFCCDVYRDLQ
jgi:hypothetical protein